MADGSGDELEAALWQRLGYLFAVLLVALGLACSGVGLLVTIGGFSWLWVVVAGVRTLGLAIEQVRGARDAREAQVPVRQAAVAAVILLLSLAPFVGAAQLVGFAGGVVSGGASR